MMAMRVLLICCLFAVISLLDRSCLAAENVVVFYKRGAETSIARTDALVQAAINSTEEELIRRGFTVVQPTPEIYKVLDKGPSTVVTFVDSGGYTVLFSAEKAVRDSSSPTRVVTEVRVTGRLFLGARVLAARRSEGRVEALRGSEQAGFEVAGARAGKQLAEQIAADVLQVAKDKPAEVDGRRSFVLKGGGDSLGAGRSAPAVATSREDGSSRVGKIFGLLVGVASYSHLKKEDESFIDLPAVLVDINIVERTLAGVRKNRSETDIRKLVDSQATYLNLREELKRIEQEAQFEDAVVLYISAHGAPKNLGVHNFGLPVLHDFSQSEKARKKLLGFEEIQFLLQSIRVKNTIFVVDTCHAGGAGVGANIVIDAKGGQIGRSARSSGFDPAVAVSNWTPTKNLAVLASSLPDQQSLGDKIKGSFFTQALEIASSELREGRSTIREAFEQVLGPKTVEFTKGLCAGESKENQCGGYPAQFPMLGIVGRGDQIRF